MDLILIRLPTPPHVSNRIDSDRSILNGPYLMSATYNVLIRQWSGAHSCEVQYGFAWG